MERPKTFIFEEGSLYTKIYMSKMTMGEAIDVLRLGHEGDKITRAKWLGYWTYEKLEGLSNPILIATLRGSSDRVPATAYQEDMLADDWMVVE